jgi:hypothetical protein
MFVEHSLNLTLVAAETEHLLTKINYPALIKEQKNRLIIHEKNGQLKPCLHLRMLRRFRR